MPDDLIADVVKVLPTASPAILLLIIIIANRATKVANRAVEALEKISAKLDKLEPIEKELSEVRYEVKELDRDFQILAARIQ